MGPMALFLYLMAIAGGCLAIGLVGFFLWGVFLILLGMAGRRAGPPSGG